MKLDTNTHSRRRLSPGRLSTLAVLAVATAILAVTLAVPRFLPFVDYPQHTATVAALHDLDDPSMASHYELAFGRSQTWIVYGAAWALSAIFGAEAATRLVVTLTIVALPLAMALFLRAHRRPAILGALTVPVALHAYVFWGFIHYVAAVPLALIALAGVAELVRRPTRGRGVFVAVAALVVFYTHAQVFAWFAGAALVQWTAMSASMGWRRGLESLKVAVPAAVPSVIAVVTWLARSRFLDVGEIPERAGVAASAGAIFTPVAKTVSEWKTHSFGVYRDGGGDLLALAFLGAIGVVVAARGARGSRRPLATAGQSWAPEAVLAGTILCYLFAPTSFKLVHFINVRFLPVALMLMTVLGPVAVGGVTRVRGVIMGLVVILSVITGFVHVPRWKTVDAEVGALNRALSVIEPGYRTLGLVFDRESEVVALPVHMHLHQYVVIRRGGLAAWSFVELPKSPITYRPETAPPPFPPTFEWHPERFDYPRWGPYFDYLLVRLRPGQPNPTLFPPGTSPLPEVIYNDDRWVVFARATSTNPRTSAGTP